MNCFNLKGPLLILIVTTLVACGVSNNSEAEDKKNEVSSRVNFEKIYKKILNYDELKSDPKLYSEILGPEIILESINPLFSVKKRKGNLEYIRFYEFDGYILKTIPINLLNQLTEAAYQDDVKTGFVILQASFWKKVKQLQNEGFKIGFLSSNVSQSIAGVYFPGTKTMLFSVIAPQGTLEHELRHHTQFELNKTLMNEPDNEDDFLSSDCISDLSNYFGELDATTIELEYWNGIFEQYNTDYRNQKPISNNASSASFFSKSIDYPRSKGVELKASNRCPDDLIAKVEEITKYINSFNSKINDDLLNLKIASSKSKRLIENENNDVSAEEYAEYQTDASNAKLSINSKISSESTSRPEKFKNWLPYLFKEYHMELCNRIASYQLLTSCQGSNE
jgi:hypothetical protein